MSLNLTASIVEPSGTYPQNLVKIDGLSIRTPPDSEVRAGNDRAEAALGIHKSGPTGRENLAQG